MLWQVAQTLLVRCSARRVRNVVGFAVDASRFTSTPGGGGEGGIPNTFSRIQAPRITGDVRFATEVTVRTAPLPSRPRRGLPFGRVTLRKWSPTTPSMP